MKTQRANLIVFLIFALTSTVAYSEKNDIEEIPSLEMLEFLGDFETKDGVWIDAIALDELQSETENMPHKTEQEK